MTPSHSFWTPDDFEGVWRIFKEIARREGKSAGVLIREFVVRYVDVHDPGNPQARITSYVEGGPVDVAIIEGRVREMFRARREVLYRDIVKRCKEDVVTLREPWPWRSEWLSGSAGEG